MATPESGEVARGDTRRSSRTVANQVASSYRKLGVSQPSARTEIRLATSPLEAFVEQEAVSTDGLDGLRLRAESGLFLQRLLRAAGLAAQADAWASRCLFRISGRRATPAPAAACWPSSCRARSSTTTRSRAKACRSRALGKPRARPVEACTSGSAAPKTPRQIELAPALRFDVVEP